MRAPGADAAPAREPDTGSGRAPAGGGALLGAAYRALTAAACAAGRVAHAVAFATGARERRDDLAERLALPAALRGLAPGAVWIHAASVGEARSVAPLVPLLAAAGGTPRELVLTTSTPTGRRVGRDELGLATRLSPWDSRGPVDRFLAAARPALHVIVETELWPLRLARLARLGVPTALVCARLSAARWPAYRRLAALYGPALAGLDLVAPAGPGDRSRLLALGARESALGPEGSLKWDAAPEPPAAQESERLRRELGLDPGVPWIVLGSAHPGEAGPLAAALLGPPRALGLVVAPRHPRRFDELGRELASRGHAVHRASSGPCPPGARLVLLDRLGVLPRVYPLAAVAVVGGTFVDLGGHSPLEAAAAGCPAVTGPHVEKQDALVEPLEDAGGLVRTAGAAEAARAVLRLVEDPAARDRAGAAARAEVERRRGHAARLAAALERLLA